MAHELERISRTKEVSRNIPRRWYAVCDCFWASTYKDSPIAALGAYLEHEDYHASKR